MVRVSGGVGGEGIEGGGLESRVEGRGVSGGGVVAGLWRRGL